MPFTEGNLTAAQKTALGSIPGDKVKYLRGEAVSGYRYPLAETGRHRELRAGVSG